MQKVPTLSVIIPAFNVKTYIRQAVQSVLGQTFSDLEVIVIDDGSTDGTMEALEDIEDQRLFRLRQNHSGIASALNSGIKAARGSYLGFLDGDDLWPETKAARHLSFMLNHPEKDLTFCRLLVIDESGFPLVPMQSYGSGDLSFQDLLIGCPNGSAVIKRSAIERAGPFDSELIRSEDLDMWLRVALQGGGNIYCLPEFLAFYRRRSGQLTANIEAMDAGWQQIIEKFSILAPDEIRKCKDKANQARYRYYTALAYEQRAYSRSLSFLRKSLFYATWSAILTHQTWFLAGMLLCASFLPQKAFRFLTRTLNRWKLNFSGYNRRIAKVSERSKGVLDQDRFQASS